MSPTEELLREVTMAQHAADAQDYHHAYFRLDKAVRKYLTDVGGKSDEHLSD
jgi:hypothetical protein